MATVDSMTNIPGSNIEPLNERGSAVRFETQCIVIPDPAYGSMRPRVVTKSYALPLWKRRTSSAGPSVSAPSDDVFFEENQSNLVLRVPLPTLSLKPRLRARSVDDGPLPPCLVHRPSYPGTPSLNRHARTPRKPSPSPSFSDILTVPLRPCCAACQPVTEAALADGDAWPVQFSRAASKRRSLSPDSGPRTITIAGSAASAFYGDLGVSINVDEVDKRRRSIDTDPSTTNPETLRSNDAKAKGECKVPLVLRLSAPSNSSVADAHSTRTTPATPRIPEEDGDDEHEDELFPLPTPKGTPTASPASSPAGSLSSLAVAQANQHSTASPTPSTCSGDSVSLHPSRHFLAPPPCPSSSSLSLPKTSGSTTDLSWFEDLPRAPSPQLMSSLPSLSGRLRSRSPSPRISFVPPTSADVLTSAAESNPPETPRPRDPVTKRSPTALASTVGFSQSSTSPRRSPPHPRFLWRSKRSVSAEVISHTPTFSPSTSSTLSASPNTKKSFAIPRPQHIIADVLRGVGTVGSGSIGLGI